MQLAAEGALCSHGGGQPPTHLRQQHTPLASTQFSHTWFSVPCRRQLKIEVPVEEEEEVWDPTVSTRIPLTPATYDEEPMPRGNSLIPRPTNIPRRAAGLASCTKPVANAALLL